MTRNIGANSEKKYRQPTQNRVLHALMGNTRILGLKSETPAKFITLLLGVCVSVVSSSISTTRVNRTSPTSLCYSELNKLT